ncbi:hypothetical protein ACF0H5_002247 [Mactra antiquata]
MPADDFSMYTAELPSLEEGSTDWNYVMRREMQEIIPGLYLGPYAAAMKSKKAVLVQHGITHIVCIRQKIEANFIKPNFPNDFQYLVMDIADVSTENIIPHLPLVKDFIDGCLNCQGRVLVHGNAGISRSAALVIGYIMEKYGLTYKNAFNYVQQKRFCITPNEGFMQQLIEFEAIYMARKHMQIMEQSDNTGTHNKRKYSFDTEECIHDPTQLT